VHEVTDVCGGSPDLAPGPLGGAQAVDLALLVDLEARWENLRHAPRKPGDVRATTPDLHGRQRAYEAFRTRLAAYNKRYRPAHVPELLLNTPARFGRWCRSMRDLLLVVENEPGVGYPAHLLEKARRLADWLGGKLARAVAVGPPPATVRGAIECLEALALWCDDLAGPHGPCQGGAGGAPPAQPT
jgi:hypothetical protein